MQRAPPCRGQRHAAGTLCSHYPENHHVSSLQLQRPVSLPARQRHKSDQCLSLLTADMIVEFAAALTTCTALEGDSNLHYIAAWPSVIFLMTLSRWLATALTDFSKRVCSFWCHSCSGVRGLLMQRLLVPCVSLLQPSAGCLHGMHSTSSIDPLANRVTSPKFKARLPCHPHLGIAVA